jgi:hypothetical protein
LEQTIGRYLGQSELLLQHAGGGLRAYIAPLVFQLNKLKKVPPELLNDSRGNPIFTLIELYLNSLNKTEVNKDELFAQLLLFNIESVLIIRKQEKLKHIFSYASFKHNFGKN